MPHFTEVTFGSDIDFHVPDKPFVNLKEEEPPVPVVREHIPENNAPSSKTNAAVYDRNWLLQ